MPVPLQCLWQLSTNQTIGKPPMDKSSECKPCAKGVPMWMATFSDMAILLMAFFVLLIAFNDTEMAGAQMITGKFDDKFGVQNTVPVVERPKGNNVLTRSFSPSHVKETIDQVVQEVTTDIRPELDNVLTRYNREKMYRKNSQVEQAYIFKFSKVNHGRIFFSFRKQTRFKAACSR